MDHFEGAPLRHMGDLPAMAADRYGDETLFTAFGQSMSFRELDEAANRVANVLVDHGVDPGDRVGLFIPNTTQFPEAYFGAIRAGAVPVPLNLRMDPNTLVYVLDNSEADHVVASPLLADEAQDLAAAADVGTLLLSGVSGDGVVNYSQAKAEADVEFDRPDRAYDDVACQPYTSGTTGNPKGVLLTHENLLSSVEAYTKGGLAVDADDSIVLVLPLFHIYALNAILGTYLAKGATMHLQPEPDGEQMLTALTERNVTTMAGVPAMYTMMWREYRENPEKYDLSALRYVNCAAAPLADEVRRTIEEAWNVPMIEGWGMTETAPAGTVEPAHGVRKPAGCIGPALENIEMKLVDPETRETRVSYEQLTPFPDDDIDFDDEEQVTGEIAIRGPNVFEGYFGLPEKTEQVFDDEGFFYTEDIARVDEDGYFWMVDRADDMIIAGGENIYPAEVENALYEHPDVAEAAVVAAPHEVKGEAPVAFVVLEEGSDATEADLREFTLDHVATYAHPRRVFFVDELPRSATQKVQRYKLEEEAEQRLDGPLSSSEEL
ncbi:class I adenylate-forming enzyme family protein [Halorarius halobius]|uniref:class I adenylate-forming enzyme family protein n=1 Tax=Halorarius halobius TaxID=2962671 RepID=UPI0020CB7F92|nr:class I adenylate-forming enzyme family protein [Halorarius halobius]